MRCAASGAAVAGGIGAITLSALLLALLPHELPVAVAEVLHGFASCVLTPAVAAVSLRLVGHAGFAERLGRNARYAAIGNGTAAAAMGALGTYVSTGSVFLLTAALSVPALIALHRIGAAPARPAQSALAPRRRGLDWSGMGQLLADRRLLAFGGCIVMFHMANAAMLPIAAGAITARAGTYASSSSPPASWCRRGWWRCSRRWWGGAPSPGAGAPCCSWAGRRCRSAPFCSPSCPRQR